MYSYLGLFCCLLVRPGYVILESNGYRNQKTHGHAARAQTSGVSDPTNIEAPLAAGDAVTAECDGDGIATSRAGRIGSRVCGHSPFRHDDLVLRRNFSSCYFDGYDLFADLFPGWLQ
jgi:hypothetical protein